MSTIRQWCRNNPEYIILIFLFICVAGYSIWSAYGFLIFPDEYTYWAYAGAVGGYDWSDVTSLGAYYSYGYSIILTPIFCLCKNAVTAYRTAVGINFIMLIISFRGLTKLSRRILQEKEMPVALFAAVAASFSGYLFSAQMTLTETLLVTVYIAVGMLLYRYLESNNILSLTLLTFLLAYLYTVHMRSVGVLLSALAALVFHIFSEKGKKAHIVLPACILGFSMPVCNWMKTWAYANVFGGLNEGLVSANDYAGQLDKIKYIFTLPGLWDTAIHILGKLWYLNLASFGLFAWGLFGCVKAVFDKNEKRSTRIFLAYVLFTVITQVMISVVYLVTLGEISDYTYGRYNEMVLPVVCVIGMSVVWEQPAKKVWKVMGAVSAVHLLSVLLIIRQIIDVGADVFCGYFTVGISWLYNVGDFEVFPFYMETYLAGTFFMAVAMGVLLAARSSRNREKALLILVIIEICTAARADYVYLKPFKRAAYRDYCLAKEIERLYEEKENPHVLFRYEVYPSYIGILQFMMRDIKIEVDNQISLDDIDEETILIFPFDDAVQEEWKDEFTYENVYGHFTVFYN